MYAGGGGGVARRDATPGKSPVTLAVVLVAIAGCGGSRLEDASISLWGSDLLSVGPAGYAITLSVFGDTACKGASPNPAFTMTLDGTPLAYDDCIAGASGFLENRRFKIQLHDGDDAAEIVVADLFPGLGATAPGEVTAGGTFNVPVPAALQFETPVQFGARFIYVDADDPSYLGDATNAVASSGGIQMVAPQHLGHFTLWIAMSAPVPSTHPGLWPNATVASCSGLSSCTAFGAPDIGPLAVEVMPAH